MAHRARGTFEVQANREPPYDTARCASLGRSSFTKQFQGELEGTSVVQMLSAMSEIKGSAGYVALERVTGSVAAAWFGWAAISLSAPWLLETFTVYPDGLGAAVVLTGFWALLRAQWESLPSPLRGRHCDPRTGSRRGKFLPASDSHARRRRRNRRLRRPRRGRE